MHEYIYHSTVLHGAGYAPYDEPVPFDILAALLKEGWRPIAPAVAVEPSETQIE
ncbi:MAG: hypothetical protein L0Y74_06000 [candidate division Zixibacteria bacterium]|nr:hypothetical protein [candidate division Zixibacteria bacterium]